MGPRPHAAKSVTPNISSNKTWGLGAKEKKSRVFQGKRGNAKRARTLPKLCAGKEKKPLTLSKPKGWELAGERRLRSRKKPIRKGEKDM